MWVFESITRSWNSWCQPLRESAKCARDQHSLTYEFLAVVKDFNSIIFPTNSAFSFIEQGISKYFILVNIPLKFLLSYSSSSVCLVRNMKGFLSNYVSNERRIRSKQSMKNKKFLKHNFPFSVSLFFRKCFTKRNFHDLIFSFKMVGNHFIRVPFFCSGKIAQKLFAHHVNIYFRKSIHANFVQFL